jgi:hypothetical protein
MSLLFWNLYCLSSRACHDVGVFSNSIYLSLPTAGHMRKGMDGLSSLVRTELDLDPMAPSLFSLIEAMIKLSCCYGSVIAFGSFISDL